MLLGDSDVEAPVGERRGEAVQPGRVEHGRGDGDDPHVSAAQPQQLLGEHLGQRLPGDTAHRLAGQGVDLADGVEAVLLVVLRGLEALALAGDAVHQHGTAELPRLLERAGPGIGDGNITGLFTVLVDGDDHNEPIADAVRGILDGHIVMERAIGERGRYPAINILRSVSRTMPGCNTDQENALVGRARRLLSAYNDMAEMIRLGAYRRGSDPLVDEAIEYNPAIEEFLKQGKRERTDMETGYAKLAEILNVPWS